MASHLNWKLEEEALGKFYDFRLFKRLLSYVWPYKGWVFLAVAAMLLASGIQVLGPLLTKLAIDRYLVPVAGDISPLDPWLSRDPFTGLAQVSLLYGLTLVLGLGLDFLQNYVMARTGQHAMYDLRRETLAHLQRIDVAYYDKTPVGRLLTRVTTDADALNELLASGLVALLGDIIMLAAVFVIMLKLNVGLTLMLGFAAPFLVLTTMRFRSSITASNRRIRVAVARINSFLQEHITGMAVLQLFNREERARRDFEKVNREHMDAYKDAIIAYGWFYPVVEFIAMTSTAGLLAYGGWLVRDGTLSLGVLVAFFQYGMRFFRPLQDLSEKYNILQSAATAAERIFHLLDTPVAIQSPAEPRNATRSAAIEFDHVWFAYKDDEWVLRDLTFRLEPGETVAVVGHTGAGKTTLTNLLLRFYDVQRGAIRIGGIDIRELDPYQLRERFAVVLQDPFLFTGTLRDNIRLGSAIPDTKVKHAIDEVNLKPFVESLNDGLDHEVRERGAGLSTGQKQLVSFARALAHDPQVLILDEATSSVDTQTELRIREALEKLIAGRTSLIIAHRLSTIQRANRILVMHKGQLRESGTHQQLLAQRGLYWKLYRLQYKDQEVTVPGQPSSNGGGGNPHSG